jgi:hypothetical protein
MRNNNLLIRLGVAGAALTGAAGLGLLGLSSAPSALADSCTSTGGGNACPSGIGVAASASVAVASSTILTLNTTTISFPAATTLPVNVPATVPVTGTVTSNDANGWSVDVEAVSTPGLTGAACGDLVGGSNAAPSGGLDDYLPIATNLRVTGNNGGSGFLTSVATPCGQTTPKATDTGTGAETISDAYQLSIAATTEQDTYSTTLNYTIIGN